ncbi:MFS general substrate transporter [Chloropicon primus]|uniref:MFS general substrate transporter n=1 Tax=Chloropicon primus TaxID=1764295 RepID=A0A5B8MDK5_9CHLO|nr:MFS general substrate transporter [Chloropicon primus]|eukprot:QDZ18656.1 MFS general substrate transporter [Chloropicon primus]
MNVEKKTGENPAVVADDGVPRDLKGNAFDLPVDTEHKAKKIKLLSFARPHMRAFHLSWMSFFVSFLSTFAAAPMIPVIRNNLDLTKEQLGDAGIAAVTGTIFCRIAMGFVCDTLGPRYGHSSLLLGTVPAVFGMALADGSISFLLCRFFIGFSLATFVATQFWSSVMFNGKIVGTANATTAGWGNLGGGVTQFLMPVIYTGLLAYGPPFQAWRMAYFVPGSCQMLLGMVILFFAQDLPDGQYKECIKAGEMAKPNPWRIFKQGVSNYRMWCMVLTYGQCFGVELTMNNIISPYLFDQFDLNIEIAGALGSLFGLMNLFARSLGGLASDLTAAKYGMRGRLWTLWVVQTLEGGLCIVLGRLYTTLPGTLVCMIMFSLTVQMAEGASYGVVPYISKRALGICSGFIGAGGNAGSTIAQAIFFKGAYSTQDGITYMGVMIVCVTLLVIPIYFPMWGGMFCGPKEGVTEVDYYLADFTEEEKEAGVASSVLKFAKEAASERAEQDRPSEDDDKITTVPL